MGNFYTNHTLRGPGPEAVAEALAGRRAWVTPAQQGCVIVFDEESDEQSNAVSELAAELSQKLSCPVWAVLNHDDDILWYELHRNGKLIDEYNSTPGYFDDSADPSQPEGGNAQKLCEAFGSSNVAEVEAILRKSQLDEDGYVFAVERHEDLTRALGVPDYGVGMGYGYISRGELPAGLEEHDLFKVG